MDTSRTRNAAVDEIELIIESESGGRDRKIGKQRVKFIEGMSD